MAISRPSRSASAAEWLKASFQSGVIQTSRFSVNCGTPRLPSNICMPAMPTRFIHSRSAVMPSLVTLPFSQCHHTRGFARVGRVLETAASASERRRRRDAGAQARQRVENSASLRVAQATSRNVRRSQFLMAASLSRSMRFTLPSDTRTGTGRSRRPRPRPSPSCFGAVMPVAGGEGLAALGDARPASALGRRTVARVLAGPRRVSSNAPSLQRPGGARPCRTGSAWLALTFVNPPPGRGWMRMCL